MPMIDGWISVYVQSETYWLFLGFYSQCVEWGIRGENTVIKSYNRWNVHEFDETFGRLYLAWREITNRRSGHWCSVKKDEITVLVQCMWDRLVELGEIA